MVRLYCQTEKFGLKLVSGNRVPARQEDLPANLFRGCWKNKPALSLALALSFTVFSLARPTLADPRSVLQLRGSDGVPIANSKTLTHAPHAGLRGAVVDYEIVEPLVAGEVEDITYEDVGEEEGPSFLSDVGSALFYLRDNLVPVIMFRGSTNAVSERNVTYTIPERGVLRNSMMHSANVYQGLRGSAASVGDTVATALRGSYSARAQLERANIDRVRVHGALANYLPKVTGTIDANYSSSPGSSVSTNSGGRIVTGGIEVTMPLFTSGVNLNTYKQAVYLSRASEYSYLAEEHRVALEAVAAHVNLRLNRKIEQTLKGNVNAMQRIEVIARKLFEAGDASRTDIAIAVANVQSARSELDLARRSREETKADYESVTGKQAPARLAGLNTGNVVPNSLEEAVDMAMRYNPALASSLQVATASKYAAKVERGRFGPQINMYGNYNYDFYRSTASASDGEWRVGVRLSVPLFDATLAPSVNAARHEALENGYRALDQGRLIERQVERQWSAYHSAARRTTIVQRQVNAISISVKGAQREFQAGFRSITDVLTEQIKLARAKITLETARHEKMLAAYELAFTTANPALKNLANATGYAVTGTVNGAVSR